MRPFRFALLVAALCVGSASQASADNGRLNLHIDLGFGSGVAGPLAPPGKNDKLAHVIPQGWVSMDYVIAGPFAIEAIGGVGYLIDLESAKPNVDEPLIYNVGLGGRLRFMNDESGYKKQGGKLASNLWVSAHAGWHQYDGGQIGIDGAVGYELSIAKPFQLGFFLRGQMTFKGDDDQHLDAAAFAGISLGFELLGHGRKDSDGDGLDDERERKLGTDPMSADTDGDGISDGVEVRTNTNPLSVDTDSDGVPDNVEDANMNGKVDPGETDPRVGATLLDEDTDGDSVPDSADVCPGTPNGTNVDAKGCPKFEGKTFSLTGVTFKSGSSELEPTSETSLTNAVYVLKANPEIKVEIAGHTDNRGKRATNLKLSQERADSVKAYLVEHGIDAARLTTKGYGPNNPIESNKTADGRAANRRIEFTRLD
ncbi:MAG: OmpA family protein [Polyangiales bacterium]